MHAARETVGLTTEDISLFMRMLASRAPAPAGDWVPAALRRALFSVDLSLWESGAFVLSGLRGRLVGFTDCPLIPQISDTYV